MFKPKPISSLKDERFAPSPPNGSLQAVSRSLLDATSVLSSAFETDALVQVADLVSPHHHSPTRTTAQYSAPVDTGCKHSTTALKMRMESEQVGRGGRWGGEVVGR